MRNENEQTKMLNDLVSRIKTELLLGDFKDHNEMVEYLSNKAKNVAYNADNYGYNEAKNIAEDVAMRIEGLKGIKKVYHIPNRIKDIINEVKY